MKDIAALDSSEYEVQKESLKNSLRTRKQNQHLQAWLDELKDNAEIIDFIKQPSEGTRYFNPMKTFK